MGDYTRKSGTCRNCKITTEAVLHFHVKMDGSSGFVWMCARCNVSNPFSSNQWFIKKELVQTFLTAEQIENLPVLITKAEVRCVVCGERFAQQHHWAPRAIFGDKECEQWPKDYLCQRCHTKWHKAVTPQLVRQ